MSVNRRWTAIVRKHAKLRSATEDNCINPHILHYIVVNFLIASRDTTSQALAWPLYNAMQYPEVERKIHQPDAKEYKPERWIDPETGKIKSVSAYKFPTFNAGPRICLGMNLALVEIKIVVASLLSKFHLELVPDQDIKYDFSLAFPVRGALFANIIPVATAV